MRKVQKIFLDSILRPCCSLQKVYVCTSATASGEKQYFLRALRSRSVLVPHSSGCFSMGMMSGLRYASFSSSSPGSSSSSRLTSEDDDDIERERVLREKFSNKIRGLEKDPFRADRSASSEGNAHQTGGGGSSGGFPSFNPFGGTTFSFSKVPPFSTEGSTPLRSHRSLFFWLLVLLPLPFLMVASRWRSVTELHWLELPILSSSYYIVSLSVLSRSEQYRIQNDYISRKKTNPYLTLEEFMRTFYPNALQGYVTSQEEIVAAVATCLATEDSIRFLRTIRGAVWATMDSKTAVDRIMEALRRDYPQNFIV